MPTIESHRPATKSSYIERLFDVLHLLLKRPRTAKELIEVTGYKSDTIYKYLLAGVQHGVLHVCKEEVTPDGQKVYWYAVEREAYGSLNP